MTMENFFRAFSKLQSSSVATTGTRSFHRERSDVLSQRIRNRTYHGIGNTQNKNSTRLLRCTTRFLPSSRGHKFADSSSSTSVFGSPQFTPPSSILSTLSSPISSPLQSSQVMLTPFQSSFLHNHIKYQVQQYAGFLNNTSPSLIMTLPVRRHGLHLPSSIGRISCVSSRRLFSSDSQSTNGKNENGRKDTSAQNVEKENTTNGTESDPQAKKIPLISDMPNAPARTAAELAKIRQNFANYEETIKRVASNATMNTSDLLSVYSIVALIIIIGTSPFFIRHMRKSDSTYEDIDPEDPVTDLAAMIRGEYFGPGNDDPEKEGRSQSALGLDSIVADLLKSQQVADAASHLVTKIIESSQFKRACQVLLKELWTDLIEDEETLKQVIHLLQHAIEDPKIKNAAVKLVMEVFADDEVLDELVVLVQRLGVEKQVQDATQALLVESAHNALNDPEILDHSMEFATDVVGDDVVQQTAGEALYNTLSYAVTPTLSVILSILGLCLISVSILAFRSAHRSPNQNMSEDALLKALEDAGSRLYKIMNLPIDLLTAFKDAVVSVFLLPFRIATKGLSKVRDGAGTIVDAIRKLIDWLLALPNQVWYSIVLHFKMALRDIQISTGRQIDRIAKSLMGSDISASMFALMKEYSSLAARARVQLIVLDDLIASITLKVEKEGTKAVAMAVDRMLVIAADVDTRRQKAAHQLLGVYNKSNEKLTDWALWVESFTIELTSILQNRFLRP